MWDFLSNVLEQAGVVAALYFLTLIGVAFAFRAMWHSHQTEATKRLDAYKAFEEERTTLLKGFTAELAEQRRKHEIELRKLNEQVRAEASSYAMRLDALHERRVVEMRDLTTKTIGHIASIDQTVGKLGSAVDVLIRITDGGR